MWMFMLILIFMLIVAVVVVVVAVAVVVVVAAAAAVIIIIIIIISSSSSRSSRISIVWLWLRFTHCSSQYQHYNRIDQYYTWGVFSQIYLYTMVWVCLTNPKFEKTFNVLYFYWPSLVFAHVRISGGEQFAHFWWSSPFHHAFIVPSLTSHALPHSFPHIRMEGLVRGGGWVGGGG